MGRHDSRTESLSTAFRLCLVLSVAPLACLAEQPEAAADPGFRGANAEGDPVRWIMAQAPQGPSRAPGVPPPLPPAAPAAPARSSLMALLFNDASEGRRLQLAPIRWRGNLTLEQRWFSSEEGGRRNETFEFAAVDMSTYIAQPWIAQVRANLGLMLTQQRFGGDEAFRGTQQGDRTATLTGGASLAVFPTSRFPFTATVESSDSRASGELTPSDYTNRMVSLRQTYRSPLGNHNYSATFERSQLDSESFGRDTVTSVGGNYQTHFQQQQVEVMAAFARNRRDRTRDGSDIGRLSARHSWRPAELATVESFAAFSSSDFDSGSGSNRTRYLQVNSFGTWRPEEESPLFLTGGVRMSDATFGTGDVDSSSRTLGAHAGATYALTEHATVSATGSVTSLSGGGESTVVTTQSAAATYSPTPIRLGPLNYSWSVNGTATNQTGGVEGGQHAIGGQANHQLGAGFSFGKSASITASVNQGYGAQNDSLRGVSQTLVHSASTSLRMASDSGATEGTVSVNVGDSRTTGGREEHFQLLNLQVSGQLRLGLFSMLAANLTVQATRQQQDLGGEARNTSVMRSGSINYQHVRVFGVPRLRFVATATFNDMQLESRVLGDVSAPRDQYTRVYEQRLQYDIGLLDFRLGTRIAELDGRRDQQVFFRVNRQFGIF